MSPQGITNQPLHGEKHVGSTDASSAAMDEVPRAKRPRLETVVRARPVPFNHRRVVGPMVGASDLAFRLLCRRHGADAIYSEMLFSGRLVTDTSYRARKLQTCPHDRPLVIQICANNADEAAAACKTIESCCTSADAIDLNLGCPLPQAEAQGFGAYLLDRPHWSRVAAIVRAMSAACDLPIFCKIRLLETVEDTIELCELLVASGCSLIAVHGRRRPAAQSHRGQRQREAADLDTISELVRAVRSVPILTNGNTQRPEDVARNLEHTGAAGLMAAEGVLINPLRFEAHATAASVPGQSSDACSEGFPGVCAAGPEDVQEEAGAGSMSRRQIGHVALEYLKLAEEYPPENPSIIRSHLMWMLGRSGKGHHCKFAWRGPFTHDQLRMALVDAELPEDFARIVRLTLLE